MGKSDLNEQDEWGECLDKFKMDQVSGDASGNEKDEIHSGHFMISSLDDEGQPPESVDPPGYDFSSATQETANTYHFGENVAVEIDTSLSSLFQCMSLAYSGRLTSPKWKNFKGLKVSVKEKVRLNNIIWREWHMQYIQGKGHKICQFENPLTDKPHIRPEAVVLEGKYWKRKLTNVTSEYQRWRMYHKELQESRNSKKQGHLEGNVSEYESYNSSVFRFGQSNRSAECLSPPLDPKTMEEDLMMELSDTLFSSLSGPFLFPNPREFGQLGNADIIQPGLVQLQPTVEEFMDTLEPLPSLQEMVSGSKMAGSSSSPVDSLFIDSQPLLNQPQFSQNSLFNKAFISGRSSNGTDSPQLTNSSSTLVNPNAVLGNSGPVSPEFTASADLSSNTSGYASNNNTNSSSLLSDPQRSFLINNTNSNRTKTVIRSHSDSSSHKNIITFGQPFDSSTSNSPSTNNSSQISLENTTSSRTVFKKPTITSTQPRPNLTVNNARRQLASQSLPPPPPPHHPATETNSANTSSTSSEQGTTASSSNQSDAAGRLLSLILGNNVGGATTQLQQLIASGGNQPRGPDSILPQQILQLLLQLQQQQQQNQTQSGSSSVNQSLQETVASFTNNTTAASGGNPTSLFDSQDLNKLVHSPQQQQQPEVSVLQQGSNISDQILSSLTQCKQEETSSITNVSSFPVPIQGTLFSSTPVKQAKTEKPCQVIKYSQLQNLLQGQPVSPVAKVTQPVARVRPEPSSLVHRQASQGSIVPGIVTSSDRPDRRRSKSGDSFISKEHRKLSAGNISAGTQVKQGRFLVPQSPVAPRNIRSMKSVSKQVKIIPSALVTSHNSPSNTVTTAAAGKPSVAAHNTFLAKLLTSEKPTLIKEDKQQQQQPYPSIRPKPVPTKSVTLNTNAITVSTASNITLPMTTYQGNTTQDFSGSDQNGLSELQKGLMIAAAGQSYNVPPTVKLSDLLNNSVTIAQCSNTPIIGSITEVPTSQFQVPSPTENSMDSIRNRSRHSSNDSGDSSTPATFMLESVKEEQAHSPGRNRRKTELDPVMYKEHRRNCHINAEQKRRYNIKHGFDTLCALVPTLTQNPNAKVSKAAILLKSAEYCAKLKKEKSEMLKETDRLKQEIEALNNAIGTCQSQLPATGVPVNRQRAHKMKEKFDEYVKQRTMQNWKFWIFSIIISPLFETYHNSVSTATLEEMCRSALSWQDQHCSLTILRKVVVESLQKLSTTTDILSEPSKLPEQALQAVQQTTSPTEGQL